MINTVNKSNQNNGNRRGTLTRMLLLLCLVVVCPKYALAQIVPNDIPTIEAYIHDHKKQRSLLLARATLEESNALLHKVSKVTHREYRDINLELDKLPVPSTSSIWCIAPSVPGSMYIEPTTMFLRRLSSTKPSWKSSTKRLSSEAESRVPTPSSCLSTAGPWPILQGNARISVPPSVPLLHTPVGRSVAPLLR